MAKSDKLYKDSPKLKRKESGEVGIEKPSKAAATDIGTEGSPLPEAGDGMPVDAHQAEREEMSKKHLQEKKDMHSRHEKEHKDMHSRHEKEHAAMHSRHHAPEAKEDKEEKDKE